MKNLFNQIRVVTHIKTDTEIIVLKSTWINGELHYDCLVPQGKDLCSATYSDKELK